MKGDSFTGDFEKWMKGVLEEERLSLGELCEGNLEGGCSIAGDAGECVKGGSRDGQLSP